MPRNRIVQPDTPAVTITPDMCQPAPPPAIAHEIINEDRVARFKSEFGADIFAEIIGCFEEEMRDALKALRATMTANDTEEARKLVHLIEGCASNVGGDAIAGLCDQYRQEMRRTGQPGDPAAFENLFEDTCKQLRAACA